MSVDDADLSIFSFKVLSAKEEIYKKTKEAPTSSSKIFDVFDLIKILSDSTDSRIPRNELKKSSSRNEGNRRKVEVKMIIIVIIIIKR